MDGHISVQKHRGASSSNTSHKHQALPTLFLSVVVALKKFIFNKRFRT